MLGVIGWVIVGAALAGALLYFWNDVKEWLNNTAANVIERVLGYNARKAMQKAVCTVDRAMNNLRTRAVVYSKKHPLSMHYDKVSIEAKEPVYEVDEEVLQKVKDAGQLVQEFTYNG